MVVDDATIDGSDSQTPGTPSSPERTPSRKGGRLVPVPVTGGSSGFGLPYAPEDWPNPGDKWRWKVGTRRCTSGHWADRYLYPSPSCPRPKGHKLGFPSKLSVIEYMKEEYPQQDIGAFFASFIWKVVAMGQSSADISSPCAFQLPSLCLSEESISIETEKSTYTNASSRRLNAADGSKLVSSLKHCKAGNALCYKPKRYVLPARDCDICCGEVGFCRDCCCILCSKVVDWAYEGYSSIKCEAKLDETYICGHVAHVECALRCYMAGTVGGSIGLNIEYYCRRCENKTDLVPHVFKSLKICESLDSQDVVEKILNLCLCILRNSELTKAKKLSNDIVLAISKLKHGVHLGEIYKVEDYHKLAMRDISHDQNDGIVLLGTAGSKRKLSTIDCKNNIDPLHKVEDAKRTTQIFSYISSDSNSASAKLEDGIDKVLHELKRSQESEYRLAEQKLYYQKDFLLSLYQQLDFERKQLASPRNLSYNDNFEALLSNVQHRVGQIKHEEERLKQMMKVAHGFGRIPKSILEENFEIIVDE